MRATEVATTGAVISSPGRDRGLFSPAANSGRPVANADHSARNEIASLLVVVLVGVALRAFRLGHQSLWTDEVVTSLSSTGSLWWVVTQTTVNSNIPPLYYVVVHLVMALGRNEWVLRLPSMLFGAASVA